MILSAAIVDKDGAIFVARQYTEMTKSKVEALYTQFSRLITKGKQHTLIETNEVRYVYQAINDLYCVLITEKQSNILEDIKTLRVFISAINDYASSGKGVINEESVCENRFDLLFVFDEIVALGVRQIDSLAQLHTIIEMKSEEEKAVMEALTKKEKEAKAIAAEKSKQLDQQRRNEMLLASEKSRASISLTVTGQAYIVEQVEAEVIPIKELKVVSRGRALKLRAKK